MIKLILETGQYGQANENRSKMMILASIFGIILNVSLAVLKVFLFFITTSVSILADSLNNLTDSLSAMITLIGTKIAEKPGDDEHPHGHGRVEYISALIISSIVFMIGALFMKMSFERIIKPEPLEFSDLSIFLMLITIFVKIYMVYFFGRLGKLLNALPLRAQSKDYLGDVFMSSIIFLSMIVYKYSNMIIDGYVGIFISLFILYNGYELIKDTISEIIGKVPREFVNTLKEKILSYDDILSVHDIIVTNYGAEKIYVTADVEIDYKMSLLDAHQIIDEIERTVKKEFGCILSLHIDPVGVYSEKEKLAKEIIEKFMLKDARIQSFHDLLHEENLLIVDVVVDGNFVSENEAEEIKRKLKQQLVANLQNEVEITIDRYF